MLATIFGTILSFIGAHWIIISVAAIVLVAALVLVFYKHNHH